MRYAFFVLISFFLWSTTGPLLRASDLPVATFVTIANGFGVAVLLAIYGRRILPLAKKLPPGRTVLYIAGGAVNVIASFAAYRLTTIGNVLVPHYIAPLLVAVVSPALLGEKPSARSVEALAASLMGLALFAGRDMTLGSPDDVAGLALAGFSAVGYAVVILLTRDLSRAGTDPVLLSVVASGALGVGTAFFFEPSVCTTDGVAVAVVAAILHLAIAAPLYVHSLRHVRAATAGVIGYSEVVFGVLWGAFLYGERLTYLQGFGLAIIIASGCWLFSKEEPVAAQPK